MADKPRKRDSKPASWVGTRCRQQVSEKAVRLRALANTSAMAATVAMAAVAMAVVVTMVVELAEWR